MDKITSFLVRLFIAIGLLFVIIILDKNEKLDYNNVKEKLSEDFNPLKFIKIINGNSNYLKLFSIDNIDAVSVSSEYKMREEIENGYRYYLDEFEGVINEVTGVVVNIKYDGTYEVTILDSNDIKRVYSNLSTFDYHIYEYIEAGEVIGSCENYYDLVIFNEN